MNDFNSTTLSTRFFELSRDLMCTAGFDGYFKYLNPSWIKVLGYSEKELLSKPYLTFVHPDDHVSTNREVANLSKGKVTINFENRYISKDGLIKYIEWTATPLPDEKIIYCVGRDITQRKQSEIKANQQRLNLKFLNSMIIPLADKSNIDDFSKVLLRELRAFTGASLATFSYYHSEKKELILLQIEAQKGILKTVIKIAGKKITQTASPVDDETYKMIINEMVATCKTFTEVTFGAIPEFVDKTIRAATGIDRLYPMAHVIEGELFGTTMLAFKKGQSSPSIELLESYSYLMSVSLRRYKAEQALEESEKQFRQLFENMEQGFALHEMIYDEKNNPKDYRFVLVNKSFEKLIRKKSIDLIGKTVKDALPGTKQIWIDSYAKVAQTGKILHFEYYAKELDKYYKVIAYSPKSNFFAAIFTDITKDKFYQKQLLEAKEKAEESDHLKSAFLANMSHEIRTPMNGIIGFTSLLKKPNLSEEKHEKYINIIETSGARMLSTINDIIDISKIESGQVEVKISTFNLNKSLDEHYEFFLPETEKKNIQLLKEYKVSDQDAYIKSDKEKFDSVLTNLIKNAIKYTHSGKIEFGYSVIKKSKQKVLKFFVNDTGIGISKDKQNAVFERFVQDKLKHKQINEGSGLGLSISKAYLEMLGGKIWLESKEGVGSQFYFTLPYTS